jgi:hypothetical protein
VVAKARRLLAWLRAMLGDPPARAPR